MCQVFGPSISVACSICGAGYYEDSQHTCKKFVPFKKWNASLQANAKAYRKIKDDGSSMATLREAVIEVARWPKWKREYMWADEFRFSVKAD